MIHFTYFLIYSFIGFLLETAFTLVTTGTLASKKCFIIGLFCPVYGLGALGIIGATKGVRDSKILTFLIGMAAATAVEYLVDYCYERFLSVRIWNYSHLALNINGRVCLLFSLFWGVLSLLLVRYIHPLITRYAPIIPRKIQVAVMILFIIDAAFSAIVLRKFQTKQALNLSWLLKQG